MSLLNNLRKRLVRKLLRPEDGYTYTGFREGKPIKFYYQESTGKYLMGMRSDTMYYFEPTLTGWSAASSKYLPWGMTYNGHTYPTEPKKIDFQRWVHGILDNIYEQYKERLDSISTKELKKLQDYKLEESGEKLVITRKSFCNIMDALDSYWVHMNALEDVLNVCFEKGMMADIIDNIIDALEEELEPQFFDPEMNFDIDEEPLIMRWLIEFDAGRSEKAQEGVDGHPLRSADELYDYLVAKRDERDVE